MKLFRIFLTNVIFGILAKVVFVKRGEIHLVPTYTYKIRLPVINIVEMEERETFSLITPINLTI